MSEAPRSPAPATPPSRPRPSPLAANFTRPAAAWARELRDTLRGYRPVTFRKDAQAGLTVAMVALPQSMAYALVAEVPPEYGLYTLIFQCLIGSVFNSQPLLSVGPINTQSLLVAAIATRLAEPGDATLYLQLVIALTLLKGLIQIGLALLHTGGLVRYVSQSVIIGFTAGAGVLIATGQLPYLLGTELGPREGAWPGLVGTIQRLWPGLNGISGVTLIVGLVALALVLGVKKLKPIAALGPLLALVVAGAADLLLGLGERGVAMVPELPSGLPELRTPWSGLHPAMLESLLPGALALALLGLMEAYSIGRTLAARNNADISANRELFSQGLTNAATSFLGCIPGSGSFSRSALNAYAGGQTFLSSVYNGLIVLGVVLLFGGWARHVPLAVIAAILVVIAAGLIDWRYLVKTVKSNRADAATCLGTFAATLVAPLAYAVFLGIALNIALYLRRARQLYVTEMVGQGRDAAGQTRLMERPLRENYDDHAIVFLQLEGNLFFACADELQERFNAILHSPARAVILRLKRTHMVDATVMNTLQQFARRMRSQDRHVLLCGLRGRMFDRMREFGLADIIGEEQMFASNDEPFGAARRAIQRARELTGDDLRCADAQDGKLGSTQDWAYDI